MIFLNVMWVYSLTIFHVTMYAKIKFKIMEDELWYYHRWYHERNKKEGY